MSNLADLEIEDIREIAQKSSNRSVMSSFARAIKSFLANTRNDGGAESDLIFTTGVRISRSGLWEHMPAKMLAASLHNIPLERVELLLEAAASHYRSKVLAELREVKDDIEKKPLNATFALRAARSVPEKTRLGLARRINAEVGASWLEVLPPPPGNVSYAAVKSSEFPPVVGWPPVAGFPMTSQAPLLGAQGKGKKRRGKSGKR